MTSKRRKIYERAHEEFSKGIVDSNGEPVGGLSAIIIKAIEDNPHRCPHDGIHAVMSALYAVYGEFDVNEGSDHSVGGEFYKEIYFAGWRHALKTRKPDG